MSLQKTRKAVFAACLTTALLFSGCGDFAAGEGDEDFDVDGIACGIESALIQADLKPVEKPDVEEKSNFEEYDGGDEEELAGEDEECGFETWECEGKGEVMEVTPV